MPARDVQSAWIQDDFVSRLPQGKLFNLFESHDLLLFPSLHDSGGFVVLEALSHGLPVLCLDLGGPGAMVTPNCGVIVNTKGFNTAQVISRVAEELADLFASPTRLSALSAGAISRANEFILSNRVAQFYQQALSFMEGTRTDSTPTPPRSRADLTTSLISPE